MSDRGWTTQRARRHALGFLVTGVAGAIAVALHVQPAALHLVLGLPDTFTALDHPFAIWWPLAFIGFVITIWLTGREMKTLGKREIERYRLSAEQWAAAHAASQSDLRAVAADRDRVQAELAAFRHAEAQRR